MSSVTARVTRNQRGTTTPSTTVATTPVTPTAGSVRTQIPARGKRRMETAAAEAHAEVQMKKKSKKSSKLNSSSVGVEEAPEDVEMKVPESSTTSLITPSSTPSTAAATMTSSFNSVKDQPNINALLSGPLPNVLADMVKDYLFHPLFDLWDEIISVYESLPQMPKEEKAHTWATAVDNKKKKANKKKEDIELMPRLHLSPPVSPMEVDELEQQFQLKYDDPNFHFASELKFLWSIADGLECPQNHIFRGRFWPSLATMKSILACTEDTYYVMHHHHAQSISVWLKYDFRSGTFYSMSSYDDQEERFQEHMMVIVYHSITHFMKALLATLKLASVDAKNYRVSRGDHTYLPSMRPGAKYPHPPAIRVGQVHGFVPQPLPNNDPKSDDEELSEDDDDEEEEDDWEILPWDSLLGDECDIQSDDVLISGHLTSAEYFSIRQSLCVNENKWADRLLRMDHRDRDPPLSQYYTGFGFPVISSCHLLDANDGYGYIA